MNKTYYNDLSSYDKAKILLSSNIKKSRKQYDFTLENMIRILYYCNLEVTLNLITNNWEFTDESTEMLERHLLATFVRFLSLKEKEF